MIDIQYEILNVLKEIDLSPKTYSYDKRTFDVPFFIPAGTSKDIINNGNEEGILEYIYAVFTSPNVKIEIETNNFSKEFLISDLPGLGLTSFNPRMLWCPIYDDVNKKYVVQYTPIPLPKYKGLRITITALEDTWVYGAIFRYVKKGGSNDESNL